jgi:hypothetical protein
LNAFFSACFSYSIVGAPVGADVVAATIIGATMASALINATTMIVRPVCEGAEDKQK